MDSTLSKKDFKYIEAIGTGTFGSIHKVKNIHTGKIHVIKKVRHYKTQRFSSYKEVQVLKTVKHPNIIKYYTSFVERGHLYIVMEYVDGGDLQQLLDKRKRENKPFQEAELWNLSGQIWSAIRYLHTKGILHRDIKTQNIFLTSDNVVKLGDLGSAQNQSTLQWQKSKAGTPVYLAPEVLKGNDYDYKIDIWALGIVFYQLSTFEIPFKASNMIRFRSMVTNTQPKPVPDIYSTQWSAFISKLLDKKAFNRPDIVQVMQMIPTVARPRYQSPPRHNSPSIQHRYTIDNYCRSRKNSTLTSVGSSRSLQRIQTAPKMTTLTQLSNSRQPQSFMSQMYSPKAKLTPLQEENLQKVQSKVLPSYVSQINKLQAVVKRKSTFVRTYSTDLGIKLTEPRKLLVPDRRKQLISRSNVRIYSRKSKDL